MKKKLFSFLIILVLLAAVLPCSYADELPPMVVDGADLLSDAEEQALTSQALDIREAYKEDVIIVTTSSLSGQNSLMIFLTKTAMGMAVIGAAFCS